MIKMVVLASAPAAWVAGQDIVVRDVDAAAQSSLCRRAGRFESGKRMRYFRVYARLCADAEVVDHIVADSEVVSRMARR